MDRLDCSVCLTPAQKTQIPGFPDSRELSRALKEAGLTADLAVSDLYSADFTAMPLSLQLPTAATDPACGKLLKKAEYISLSLLQRLRLCPPPEQLPWLYSAISNRHARLHLTHLYHYAESPPPNTDSLNPRLEQPFVKLLLPGQLFRFYLSLSPEDRKRLEQTPSLTILGFPFSVTQITPLSHTGPRRLLTARMYLQPGSFLPEDSRSLFRVKTDGVRNYLCAGDVLDPRDRFSLDPDFPKPFILHF